MITRRLLLTVDAGEETQAEVTLGFANADDAGKAPEAGRVGLALLAGGLDFLAEELSEALAEEGKEASARLREMTGRLKAALKEAHVTQDGRQVRVTAKAKSREEGLHMCDELINAVMTTEVGEYVYGIDVETMEKAVIMALAEDGETLAVAESCTGGLISKRLTDVSGASAVFLGGAVTYANEAKVKMLGVSEETLAKHGAVSEETAREMASGVRNALGSDFGISVTGIAGPTGGTEEKPVGTVFVGIDSKYGAKVRRLSLSSMRDREYIRTVSATNALSMVLELKRGK
jgi:nicotinamide-nucleotide amidase